MADAGAIGWSVVGAALLLGLVLVVLGLGAAALDGSTVARAAGLPAHRGLANPVAETARLLRQQRRTTLAADRLLWRIGGGGLLLVPLVLVAVLPLGALTVFDSSVGLVWLNAADVLVWALVWLLGWGPNAAYGLIGGYRFVAQALAYELPLMFALTAPAVGAQSLRLSDIVTAQQGLWFVVWMPAAFVVVCVGILGFAVWGPLAPAAGADLAGGVLAELSGPDRLVVQAARYLLLVAGSGFAVTLFWGGTAGPVLPRPVWLLLKTVVLTSVLVAARRRVPTWRPDRFLEVGWLVLLPVSLVQLLVVSLVAVGRG